MTREEGAMNEISIQDLITALGNIRGWAAAVRAAIEAGDPKTVIARLDGIEITHEHLIATQKITEAWAEAVRIALESMEGRDEIRIDLSEPLPSLGVKPLPSKRGCEVGPILVGDQCSIDVRGWVRDRGELP